MAIYPSIIVAAPATSSSRLMFRDQGSSTLPYCMYNYNDNTKGAGTCPDPNWGSPNYQNCQQSINFVCLAISQTPASNTSVWGYETGTGQIDGQNADCYAGAMNGQGATATVSFDQCMQAFGSLMGCAESTNQNFNADCTGGTINLSFNIENPSNSKHDGAPVDASLPSYALSTPKFFGVDGTKDNFNHPDPQLAGDRTDQSAQMAQQQQEEAAQANGGQSSGTAGAEPNANVGEGEEEEASSARAVVAVGFGTPADGE